MASRYEINYESRGPEEVEGLPEQTGSGNRKLRIRHVRPTKLENKGQKQHRRLANKMTIHVGCFRC